MNRARGLATTLSLPCNAVATQPMPGDRFQSMPWDPMRIEQLGHACQVFDARVPLQAPSAGARSRR